MEILVAASDANKSSPFHAMCASNALKRGAPWKEAISKLPKNLRQGYDRRYKAHVPGLIKHLRLVSSENPIRYVSILLFYLRP